MERYLNRSNALAGAGPGAPSAQAGHVEGGFYAATAVAVLRKLEAHADRSNVFRLPRALLADDAALVPSGAASADHGEFGSDHGGVLPGPPPSLTRHRADVGNLARRQGIELPRWCRAKNFRSPLAPL